MKCSFSLLMITCLLAGQYSYAGDNKPTAETSNPTKNEQGDEEWNRQSELFREDLAVKLGQTATIKQESSFSVKDPNGKEKDAERNRQKDGTSEITNNPDQTKIKSTNSNPTSTITTTIPWYYRWFSQAECLNPKNLIPEEVWFYQIAQVFHKTTYKSDNSTPPYDTNNGEIKVIHLVDKDIIVFDPGVDPASRIAKFFGAVGGGLAGGAIGFSIATIFKIFDGNVNNVNKETAGAIGLCAAGGAGAGYKIASKCFEERKLIAMNRAVYEKLNPQQLNQLNREILKQSK